MVAKKKDIEEVEEVEGIVEVVNLDEELDKQRGTFAVGIQATIRDLMKLRK